MADLNLTLSGSVNDIGNQEEENTSSSELYYAFEKGDEILIDGDIENKKGKFFIQLLKYPENVLVYSNQKLEDLKNHRIKISERSIYVIKIGTYAFFDRRIKLTIKRKPGDESSRNFSTTVEKRTRFIPVKILEPSYHYINSTSNEAFKGGKSRISIAVPVPKDVIEWYYIFSASRNQDEIQSNLKNVSLLKDLSKVLLGLSPTT